MSYPYQGQQPGYDQYPPQGQPPYGAPPQHPYPAYGQPPMQNQPYPPQGGYRPQQPPYGAPQTYGQQPYPPQQQYGPPQAAASGYYGGPPPGQYNAPPRGQYPQQGPPQNQYGGPAPGQYTGPPTPASPGYIPGYLPNVDMNRPAEQLRDAMKGFGTNERKLIDVLSQVPDGPHMLALRQQYDARFRRSLLKDLKSETSGYFEEGLLALARGPLDQDVYCVNRAVAGLGTKEQMLNDVVLGRSNADLNAIKQAYHRTHGKDLAKEIREDLSMKTEKLFDYVMQCRRSEESAPCIPQEIDCAVDRLQQATEGTKFGANQDVVCQILAFSSDGQIRAINQRYQQKYGKPFDEVLKREFSGHMKDALRLMLGRAVDRVRCDAEQLEETMKGAGTKDQLLVSRMVRAHLNREHMRQVGVAYHRFYGRSLRDRISGECSGDYKNLMMALCV